MIPWDEFYMRLACDYRDQSKDPRLKVGCVIIIEEGIIYPGFNGDEIGGSNEPDSLEPGKSGFVHSEANAILKFNATIHKGSAMYITASPCVVCARMIVNTRAIDVVYYEEKYRDETGINILKKSGIKCEQLVLKNEEEKKV